MIHDNTDFMVDSGIRYLSILIVRRYDSDFINNVIN